MDLSLWGEGRGAHVRGARAGDRHPECAASRPGRTEGPRSPPPPGSAPPPALSVNAPQGDSSHHLPRPSLSQPPPPHQASRRQKQRPLMLAGWTVCLRAQRGVGAGAAHTASSAGYQNQLAGLGAARALLVQCRTAVSPGFGGALGQMHFLPQHRMSPVHLSPGTLVEQRGGLPTFPLHPPASPAPRAGPRSCLA